ncbi:MAG TPA: twin-arginine translocase TatA/TatE family subunit [Terriglobia bacterium]|jgi:TatA/E family protein of Tat protein translocase|nr:twin-arginine translocase TatA/TatE family subunit [Terriglobia bacterium]
MLLGKRLTVFGSGFEDIGFILFLAFLLFGPKKLPEIARVLGKGLGELRRARDEMKFSLEEELRNLELDRHHLTEDFTHALDGEQYDSERYGAVDVEVEAESAPAYGHDSSDPTHKQSQS